MQLAFLKLLALTIMGYTLHTWGEHEHTLI